MPGGPGGPLQGTALNSSGGPVLPCGQTFAPALGLAELTAVLRLHHERARRVLGA